MLLSGCGGRGKGEVKADSGLVSAAGQMVVPPADKGERGDFGDHLKTFCSGCVKLKTPVMWTGKMDKSRNPKRSLEIKIGSI